MTRRLSFHRQQSRESRRQGSPQKRSKRQQEEEESSLVPLHSATGEEGELGVGDIEQGAVMSSDSLTSGEDEQQPQLLQEQQQQQQQQQQPQQQPQQQSQQPGQDQQEQHRELKRALSPSPPPAPPISNPGTLANSSIVNTPAPSILQEPVNPSPSHPISTHPPSPERTASAASELNSGGKGTGTTRKIFSVAMGFKNRAPLPRFKRKNRGGNNGNTTYGSVMDGSDHPSGVQPHEDGGGVVVENGGRVVDNSPGTLPVDLESRRRSLRSVLASEEEFDGERAPLLRGGHGGQRGSVGRGSVRSGIMGSGGSLHSIYGDEVGGDDSASTALRDVESVLRKLMFLSGAYVLGAFKPSFLPIFVKLTECLVVAWVTCAIIMSLAWWNRYRRGSSVPSSSQVSLSGAVGVGQESVSATRSTKSAHKSELSRSIPIYDKDSVSPEMRHSKKRVTARPRDTPIPVDRFDEADEEELKDTALPEQQTKPSPSENLPSPIQKSDDSAVETPNKDGHSKTTEKPESIPIAVDTQPPPPPPTLPQPHPDLENLYVIDATDSERVTPNSDPVKVDNDLFTGEMLYMFRTTDADGEELPVSGGTPSNDAVSNYFRNKQRRFEFQYQIKLKQLPTGPVFLSCEVENPIKLSMIQRAFLGATMNFVKKMNTGFHYSIEGTNVNKLDAESLREGRYEKPHVSFIVDSAMDRIVITKPGETPPKLGGPIEEDPASIKRRKRGGLVEWSTDNIYTMATWSAYADFLTWKCLNFPGIRPFSLTTVAGPQPIHLKLYMLKSKMFSPSNHFVCDLTTAAQLEVSHKLLTSMGKFGNKYLAKEKEREKIRKKIHSNEQNNYSNQHDTQHDEPKAKDQSLAQHNKQQPYVDNLEYIPPNTTEDETRSETSMRHPVSEKMDKQQPPPSPPPSPPMSPHNLRRTDSDRGEVSDDADEETEDEIADTPEGRDDDNDEAALEELGKGMYLHSGETVLLREAHRTDGAGVSGTIIPSFVTYGGGFAVMQSQAAASMIVIEKAPTDSKYRSKLIRSGDTVMIKLVSRVTKIDDGKVAQTVKYLSIHRGWWLKWVSQMPRHNGYFNIFTDESEGSDIDTIRSLDTQTSYVRLGGSFSLRHRRWSRFEVGVSKERSVSLGGNVLGLCKVEDGSSLSDPENAEDEDNDDSQPPEMDVSTDGKNKNKWMRPLSLCADVPPSLVRSASTPLKVPVVESSVMASSSAEDESVASVDENRRKHSALLDARLDVPAWIEMMHRTKRQRQRVYVVRVCLPRKKVSSEGEGESKTDTLSDMKVDSSRSLDVTVNEDDSNAIETPTAACGTKCESYVRLRTGEDLTPLLRIGSASLHSKQTSYDSQKSKRFFPRGQSGPSTAAFGDEVFNSSSNLDETDQERLHRDNSFEDEPGLGETTGSHDESPTTEARGVNVSTEDTTKSSFAAQASDTEGGAKQRRRRTMQFPTPSREGTRKKRLNVRSKKEAEGIKLTTSLVGKEGVNSRNSSDDEAPGTHHPNVNHRNLIKRCSSTSDLLMNQLPPKKPLTDNNELSESGEEQEDNEGAEIMDADEEEYASEEGYDSGPAAMTSSDGRKKNKYWMKKTTGIGRVAKSMKTGTTVTGKRVVQGGKSFGKSTVIAGKAIKTKMSVHGHKPPGRGEPRLVITPKGKLRIAGKDHHVAVNKAMKSLGRSSSNGDIGHISQQSTKFTAGKLTAPDQSCRSVSHLLSEMSVTALSSSSPSSSVRDLLVSKVATKSDLDSYFLVGGSVELGVVPAKSDEHMFLHGCVVARCLWESHWREEWCGVYKSHLAFYAPLAKKPAFVVSFQDVQSARRLDPENDENPLPGLPLVALESAWRCHYVAFGDNHSRELFLQHVNTAIFDHTAEEVKLEKDAWKAHMWQGFQTAAESSGGKGKKWAPVPSPSKCKHRSVLNGRRMVFDVEKFKSDEEDDESSVCGLQGSVALFVEDLLKMAVSVSLESLERSPKDFINFLDAASRLRVLPLHSLDLSGNEAFCIFVNLYHCLLQHSLICSANPLTKKSVVQFMRTSCYEIGGDIFSLAELESCVIRGSMSNAVNIKSPFVEAPKASHGHRFYALGVVEPRVNFILNNGNLSHPQTIPILTPDFLEDQLRAGSSLFLSRELEFEPSRETLILPKICEVYRNDFGHGEPIDCLSFCLPYLDESTQAKILALFDDDATSPVIKFQTACDHFYSNLKLML